MGLSTFCGEHHTREIVASIQEVFGADISASLISKVTDAVIELVIEWQSKPQNAVYLIVYLHNMMQTLGEYSDD